MMTTRTTGAELRSEAAIYAEGTDLTTDEMCRAYNEYATAEEENGREPDGFQRWAEREGYGDHSCEGDTESHAGTSYGTVDGSSYEPDTSIIQSFRDPAGTDYDYEADADVNGYDDDAV